MKYDIIKTAVIIIVVMIVAQVIVSLFNKALLKTKKIDKTLKGFVKSLVKAVVYFIAVMIIAEQLGIEINSILALASVLSAAIALSAQTALSNLFGGLTMLITHPFKVDDYIAANGMEGVVEGINMFHTKLKTPDNKQIIIPNGALSNTSITNFSNTGRRRVDIKIGVSYDAKIKSVKSSLTKCIKSVEGVLEDEPFIRITAYNDSSIEYTLRVWTKTEDYWNVYFDLMEAIKSQFEKDKIEIPYNQVVIHNAK
ncbi:MAG: mechanosensitive ion channel family protein [Erysipelotrichaceae bacterium]|nr:mechanosensitive ion channel family protein [Erysipelotrichaceae bacterium]